MRVVVMEDYQQAVERLRCFAALSGHDIVVHAERPTTVAERAAQIGDAEALVLIRERTPVDAGWESSSPFALRQAPRLGQAEE